MTTPRRDLPSRRNHRTQKIRIAGQRTAYLSVHDDPHPAELFIRVRGVDCTSEVVGLYDIVGRLASLALQSGAPLEKVGEMLLGAKFEPAGPVSLHPRIKNCTSLPDLIGRHLLVEYCGRGDLGHVSEPESDKEG
jgi:hypothetical protein